MTVDVPSCLGNYGKPEASYSCEGCPCAQVCVRVIRKSRIAEELDAIKKTIAKMRSLL